MHLRRSTTTGLRVVSLVTLSTLVGCFDPKPPPAISAETDATTTTTSEPMDGSTLGTDADREGSTSLGSESSGSTSRTPETGSESGEEPSMESGSDEGTSTTTAGDTGTGETTGQGPTCTTAVDQSSTDVDDWLSYPAWQSFTAGSSGDLVEVDVTPNTYCGGDGIGGPFSIYEGEGIGGSLLYQAPYPDMMMEGLTLVTFPIEEPVSVEAGVQYTWVLSGTCGLAHGNNNPYPGGIGGGVASVDMAFETRIETCE